MWYLSLILAALVEILFLMHHADPDYMGLPLELYKILRVTAIVASAAGIFAFVRALKDPERKTKAQLVMLVLALLPTLHWVVGNNYFRRTILLARGAVNPTLLVKHLEDYPDVDSKKAARWLLKPGRDDRDTARFISDQLLVFIRIAPPQLERHFPAIIDEAEMRLKAQGRERAMRAYGRIIRDTLKSGREPDARARLLLESAARLGMEASFASLDHGLLQSLPSGIRALLADAKSQPKLSWPISTRLELVDTLTTTAGISHGDLRKRADQCRLLGKLTAAGLELREKPSAPLYRLILRRSGTTTRTTFTRSGRQPWHDVAVVLYTLELQLIRLRDGQVLYQRSATTPRSIFQFILTRSSDRVSFQREVFERALTSVCNTLGADFDVARLYGIEPEKPTKPRR